MGCASSSEVQQGQPKKFVAIKDSYESYEEVRDALRKNGLESSNLIIGVDFTKSNEWAGTKSFGGKCLHTIEPGVLNPYEQVITIVGQTLSYFDDDKLIPTYGFGDADSRDTDVFSFYPHDKPIYDLANVVNRYRQVAPHVNLSGPTSFAPLIKRAIEIVKNSGNKYFVLLIIADGLISIDCLKPTVAAITEASNYPLSIIMVGVGDGPWDAMQAFDDKLPKRKFDNFQFVNFEEKMAAYKRYHYSETKQQATFALNALMEIPQQYKLILGMGMIGSGEPDKFYNDFPALDPPHGVLAAEQAAGGVSMAPVAPSAPVMVPTV